MQKKPFSELGITPESLKAVAQMGFEEASPIQTAAIPVILTGRDVIGQSETGSGKTAAFAIPAIERIDLAIRGPQVIILCPTRELVMQVAEEVSKLAVFKKGVRELPIYGGASYERQFRGLQAGAQIIIGTPGRVIDHLERGTLSLEHVGMVVLDEADRMLDMGFREDIENILSQAKEERQTVLFSATVPPAIRQIIKRFTKDPESVQIESQSLTVPAIEQHYYEVDRRSKVEVLSRIIDIQDIKLAIVFCATKAMVDELAEHLIARGYSADRLHGDMAQTMRERVMRRFRERKFEILVATDVAARGLDVDDVEVVFNYDLPHDAEDYVHRVGRTGRAGRKGRAITFVAGREQWKLQQFMKVTRCRIERQKAPSPAEVEQRQTSRLFEGLREVLEAAEFKKHDATIDELLGSGHSATDIASALIHLLNVESGRQNEPIFEDRPPEERRERPRYEPRGGYRDDRGPRRDFRDDRGPRRDPRDSRDFRDDLGPRRDSRDFRDDRGPRPPFRRDYDERPSNRDFDDRPPRREYDERPPRRDFRRDDGGGDFRPDRDRGPRPGGDFEQAPPARSHEAGMTRLTLSLGHESNLGPGDVVGFIASTANLDRTEIGAINIMGRQSFVDIATPKVEAVIGLSGKWLKGRKVFIKAGC